MKPVLAVFDFDGTITHRDSFFPFLWSLSGSARFVGEVVRLSPVLAGYAVGLIRNDDAKQRVLTSFLGGMTLEAVLAAAEHFAANHLPGLLRPQAVERLRWHQQQGHRCVLVSASLEAYLGPWGQAMGFEAIFGSRLDIDGDNTLTGRLVGENCYGPEKVRRLVEHFGSLSDYCIYAYGDSRGDRELLESADYPFYRRMS